MPSAQIVITSIAEALEVSKLHSLQLEEGQTWSVIDAKWLQSWANYTGFDTFTGKTIPIKSQNRPGPIDNTRLIDADYKEFPVLKKGIQEYIDYGLVEKPVAELLYSWYSDNSTVRFDRPVVTVGLHKNAQLQFYPSMLKVIPVGANGEPEFDQAKLQSFNNKSTFEEIRKHLLADEEKTQTNSDVSKPPHLIMRF
jgi:hypothetical protein